MIFSKEEVYPKQPSPVSIPGHFLRFAVLIKLCKLSDQSSFISDSSHVSSVPSSKSNDFLIRHDYARIHHQLEVENATPHLPPGLSPTNFVEIHRDVDSPVIVKLLIDMGMAPADASRLQTPKTIQGHRMEAQDEFKQLLYPQFLCSSISEKKNVLLESKHGPINAEIWIENSTRKQRKKFLAQDDTILARLNECTSRAERASMEIKSFHDPLHITIVSKHVFFYVLDA